MGCAMLAQSVYAGELDDSIFERTCRDRAKKVAIKIYSDCMADERKTALEDLKTQYKDELRELKKKFETKTKKMNEGWDILDDSGSNKLPPVPLKEEEAVSIPLPPTLTPNPQNPIPPSEQTNYQGPARFPQAPRTDSGASEKIIGSGGARNSIPKYLPKKAMNDTFRDSKKDISKTTSPVVIYEAPSE